MLRHVLRTSRRLLSQTLRAVRKRSRAYLEVAALEERVTPDATPMLTMSMPAQMVLVAPAIPGPAVAPAASLSIPIPGQSIVRLDLIAPGEGPLAELADNGSNADVAQTTAKAQPEEEPAAPASNTVSDEELAAMLEAAAQEVASKEC